MERSKILHLATVLWWRQNCTPSLIPHTHMSPVGGRVQCPLIALECSCSDARRSKLLEDWFGTKERKESNSAWHSVPWEEENILLVSSPKPAGTVVFFFVDREDQAWFIPALSFSCYILMEKKQENMAFITEVRFERKTSQFVGHYITPAFSKLPSSLTTSVISYWWISYTTPVLSKNQGRTKRQAINHFFASVQEKAKETPQRLSEWDGVVGRKNKERTRKWLHRITLCGDSSLSPEKVGKHQLSPFHSSSALKQESYKLY